MDLFIICTQPNKRLIGDFIRRPNDGDKQTPRKDVRFHGFGVNQVRNYTSTKHFNKAIRIRTIYPETRQTTTLLTETKTLLDFRITGTHVEVGTVEHGDLPVGALGVGEEDLVHAVPLLPARPPQ